MCEKINTVSTYYKSCAKLLFLPYFFSPVLPPEDLCISFPYCKQR